MNELNHGIDSSRGGNGAMDDRPTIQCPHCGIVQFFKPTRFRCVRCRLRFAVLSLPVVVEEEEKPAEVQPQSTISQLVARRIFEIREAKGISQRSLAKTMACPRTYISKIECLKSIPNLAQIYRVAEALGVSVYDLVTDTESPANVARSTMHLGGIDQELVSELTRSFRVISVKDRLWLISAAARMLKHKRQMIFSEWQQIA